MDRIIIVRKSWRASKAVVAIINIWLRGPSIDQRKEVYPAAWKEEEERRGAATGGGERGVSDGLGRWSTDHRIPPCRRDRRTWIRRGGGNFWKIARIRQHFMRVISSGDGYGKADRRYLKWSLGWVIPNYDISLKSIDWLLSCAITRSNITTPRSIVTISISIVRIPRSGTHKVTKIENTTGDQVW